MALENVFAEVQYETADGLVHSDVWSDGHPWPLGKGNPYRAFLHANLDEWLDKADGTGFFYIGNTDDLKENFRDS